MPKRHRLIRLLSDPALLMMATLTLGMLVGIVAPASAQFFLFDDRPRGYPQRGGGGGGGGFFSPFQDVFPSQPQQRREPQDFSRAPASGRRDAPAERNVLVLGDAMADWLGYGLDDAFSETPEFGVIRKHKTVSGLIRYQPRGEPADWISAARTIVAAEKPDAIVVMLGLHDRTSIREPVTEKKPDPKKDGVKDGAKDNTKSDGKPEAVAKPSEKPAEPSQAADDSDAETPNILAPEKTARTPGAAHDFREDRWAELYAKKVEDMVNVLKTKGVPVLWVGLPAVRGPKATSDMLYLDQIYRDVAGKTGITYVDVWDGFVDESGRFLQQGPDFEGQTRRLRSGDGVFFTKAGARKLAHYVDREIRRLLATRAIPVALPSDPGIPDAAAKPGGPAPRPLAGPIVPLAAASVGGEELLGGANAKPTASDALVARTLVRGEPLATTAGRADDSSWPRREIGRLEPGKDVPVAIVRPEPGSTSRPDGTAVAAADGSLPLQPVKPKPRARRLPVAEPSQDFFGFQASPPQASRPRGFGPRPSGNFGPSASAPGGWFTR